MPPSHQNLPMLVLSRNKHDQTETLIQCVEQSQFMVDYICLVIWPTSLGFKVIRDFSQRPTIHYSSNNVAARNDITFSQLIHCCCLDDCVFLKREFSATLVDNFTVQRALNENFPATCCMSPMQTDYLYSTLSVLYFFWLRQKWVYQSIQCHTALTHPFNSLTFGHSGAHSWAPECPNIKKLKMVG